MVDLNFGAIEYWQEVELRIKRDTIAMEGLAEKLQEIRKERDAAHSRVGERNKKRGL